MGEPLQDLIQSSEGHETHPNNPDRHAPFHIALSLRESPNAWLSIVSRRGRWQFEGFEGDEGVLEDEVGA